MFWSRILALLLAWLPLQAAAPVVLLSFDGLAADLFTPRTMPRVWRLSEKGWRGRGLPPFPSTTFNGHSTLTTGCWPEHHGIVANGFLDPELGPQPYAAQGNLLQREPLWVAATRSGVRTAVYLWPCGDGPWQGVLPWRLEPYRSGRKDQDALAFVDEALQGGARLVMAYLPGIDYVGHRYGPDSPEMRRRMRAIDRRFAPWAAGLLRRHPGLRLVLAADHGMAGMKRLIRLPELLGDLHPALVAHGGSAYVYLQDPRAREEALRRLEAEGLRVWRREELPPAFHLGGNPRVGDLVAVAPLGTWLAQQTGEAFLDEAKGRLGAHAYPPEEPAMQTWLVVLGAGRGKLGSVPLWDLAPTVAAWLNIAWERPPDGRPIPALSAPPPGP